MADKDKKVEREGPSVSLGDIVREYTGLPDVLEVARKHGQGCEVYATGVCSADCETDAQLRKRLQERYG